MHIDAKVEQKNQKKAPKGAFLKAKPS